MRYLAMIIFVTSISANAATHTCEIRSGWGTAIGKGETPKEALENARETCGTAMMNQYFASRREIPDDVVDDISTACINLNCTVQR